MSEFQTTEQIYIALIDRVKLTQPFWPYGSYTKLDEKGELVNEHGEAVAWDFSKPDVWQTDKEPTWKDRLDGETEVLCWVSNNSQSSPMKGSFIDTIKEKDCAGHYCSGRGVHWKYATPLSDFEILEFVANRAKVMGEQG